MVVDASAMVAILLDGGADGEWAATEVNGSHISAPALMPFETANIIRRSGQSGLVTLDAAAQAHADLLRRALDLWAYEALAERAWALRDNLTAYDASSVALAELLDVPLVTLDARMATAPGIRCEVRVPA